LREAKYSVSIRFLPENVLYQIADGSEIRQIYSHSPILCRNKNGAFEEAPFFDQDFRQCCPVGSSYTESFERKQGGFRWGEIGESIYPK